MRWSEQKLSIHEGRRLSSTEAASVPPKRQTAKRRASQVRVRASAPKEFQIQIALVQHLRLRGAPGVVFFHPANGEHRDPRTAAKLKAMGVTPGVPDIVLCIDGRMYALELKRDHGGSLSPDQRAMHKRLEASGAFVATASGLDEALAILTMWGAFRPSNQIHSERTASHG